MSDLKIDERIWTDPRFAALVSRIGDREKALGSLVFAWAAAKRYRTKKKLIPLEDWENLAHSSDIVAVRLAQVRKEGVYLAGADEFFGKTKKEKEASNPLNGTTWTSYSGEYNERYGAFPVRNARSNALIKQFVQKLGEEAPDVAAFYLTHPDRFYAQSGHNLTLMVRDAEKLRTEWATKTNVSGRRQTNTEANADVAGELWRKNKAGKL